MTHAFWVARARGFRQKPAGMLHALSSWTVLEKVGISRCWVRYGAGLGLGACGAPGSFHVEAAGVVTVEQRLG